MRLLGMSARLLGDATCDPCDFFGNCFDSDACAAGGGMAATGELFVVGADGTVVPATSPQGQSWIQTAGAAAVSALQAFNQSYQIICRLTGGSNCLGPPPGWHPPVASGQPWYATTGGMVAIGLGVVTVLYFALRG